MFKVDPPIKDWVGWIGSIQPNAVRWTSRLRLHLNCGYLSQMGQLGSANLTRNVIRATTSGQFSLL